MDFYCRRLDKRLLLLTALDSGFTDDYLTVFFFFLKM